ncbi:class I SAM-dependent methyltransferase [Methylobacillus flagellatus]|uniref:class I SAM-dependent methyltransferase n=1 Tax=Methylobacillus flagellatus TaxID=405 RepID=UPI002853BB97|nr:class I SAM-dependent methyltransferase [Methylobacillus flagellatus]MDR5172938.1 class I SAM-dependent methyltransferase [Methylobacillus flagellatus]
MSDRHNYEYQVDMNGQTAPARVVRMVGERKRVLEIGAGPGSITKILTHAKMCDVTALEVDVTAIEKLAPHCKKVVKGDLNDPEWPQLLKSEIPFDVLVCADVLEHVYSPDKVLVAMTQFLDTNGYMVVSLPHVGHAAIHACLYESDFEYRDWGLLDRTHIRFFGLTNIQSLFANAGLKIIDVEFVIAAPEQTEFSERWARLPESLKHALQQNPTGSIYQVVVKAVRARDEGTSVDIRSKVVGLPAMTSPCSFKQIARRLARRYLAPELRASLRQILNAIRITRE